jgi:molybdate transport system ATP-binding protein
VTPTGIRSPEGLEFAGLHDNPLVAGQAGVAAFPPSAVSVFLTEAHGSPRNSFQVTVTDLEPHGDQIRVRAGELSADVTPEASADLGLAPGLEVFFVVKAAAVAIYPA